MVYVLETGDNLVTGAIADTSGMQDRSIFLKIQLTAFPAKIVCLDSLWDVIP